MNATLNLSPLIVPEIWEERALLMYCCSPKMVQIGMSCRGVGSLEELPCVQSWEEGFLQGMGELFPSALSSLLMSCPLQSVER